MPENREKVTIILLGVTAILALGLALAVILKRTKPIAAPVSSEPEPEISFAAGAPLKPYAEPVVILSGSDFDMGYQYSRQILQVFGSWYLRAAMVSNKHFSPEQLEALKAYQLAVKKNAPEMIDFFKGMAAGAMAAGIPMTYEEALAQFCDSEVKVLDKKALPKEVASEQLPPEREDCSGFAAWGSVTKDGKMIASGSSDGGDFMSAIIIAFPEKGNSFIYWPFNALGKYLSIGGQPGLNNKGLIFVHHGCTKKPKEKKYGLSSVIANIHTLRFANTAQDAVNMQLSYTPSKEGGFWADVQGSALVIERTEPSLIRKVGEQGEVDFLYATNTNLSKEVLAEGEVFMPRAGCVSNTTKYRGDRNLELWHMLNDYRSKVDLEFAEMMWRYSGPPEPVAATPDSWEKAATAQYTDNERAGWRYSIGRNQTSHIGIVVPDEMLYYVSTGHAAFHHNLGSPFETHGLWQYIPYATYAFFPLKLAANPVEVAKAAEYQAEIDMYVAQKELAKLTYRDAAFAPLMEIFNRAVIEWSKGDYINSPVYGTINRAPKAETIGLLAKATRAFNRCQALARQVCNVLVPPPMRPEDLNLKPFSTEKTSGHLLKDSAGNYQWKESLEIEKKRR
jgi:hypothetical protein